MTIITQKPEGTNPKYQKAEMVITSLQLWLIDDKSLVLPLKKIIKECVTNQLEIGNLNTKIFYYYKRTKEREEQEHKTDGSKGENNSKTEINFKYISRYITIKLIIYSMEKIDTPAR